MITKKQFLPYWLGAWFFCFSFGEIFLSGIVDGNPAPFRFFLPMLVYYCLLSLIFAWLAKKLSTRSFLLVLFLYGVLVETFLFKNIKGFFDIPGILFFGTLYIILFGVPLWVCKRYFN